MAGPSLLNRHPESCCRAGCIGWPWPMEFHLNILGGFWMSQVEIGLRSLTEIFPDRSSIFWSSERGCLPRTLMASL